MGASKKQFFPPNQNAIATLCNALGHPARVAIIEHLLINKVCICEDMLSILPLTRPTIWQHLQKLERAQLIQGNFKNNSLVYEIDSINLNNVDAYFSHWKIEKQKKLLARNH